ncbi:hypothetical protein TNCV_1647501 [Trichonephila clavipes]|nr:hypothetical protein TNCV_1647501 [Trichonephila clavipes]
MERHCKATIAVREVHMHIKEHLFDDLHLGKAIMCNDVMSSIKLFFWLIPYYMHCIHFLSSMLSSSLNPPTGQNGFFRPTREASKMDCTDFSAFK